MAEIILTNFRLVPLLVAAFASTGVLLTYYIAVRLDHVKPFFPFVSHAAGYPPQSGILSCCFEVTGIFGILLNVLRYVIVQHRKTMEEEEKESVEKLNRRALWIGNLAYLGLIYLAVNPVGFPTRYNVDYYCNVLGVHNVGAFGTLLCFSVYLLIQSHLTYIQRKTDERHIFIQPFIAIVVAVISSIIAGTFYFVVEDLLVTLPDEETRHVAITNTQYPLFPLVGALLEWSFIVLLLTFFVTFSRDFQYIRITLRLRPKSANSHSLISSN